jgi:hypothetical protein
MSTYIGKVLENDDDHTAADDEYDDDSDDDDHTGLSVHTRWQWS